MIKPIEPINNVSKDRHNINYRGSDLTHKASALDNMTKSFNDIFEDLKIENLEHERNDKNV